MRQLFRTCLLTLLAGVGAFAQSTQVTPNQLHYLRHLLLILGSPDASPNSVSMREHSLAIQFALNAQELTAINAAAKQYGALLSKIREAVSASPGDQVAIAALVSTRQQTEETLANQILSSVRPSTANQLRFVGDFVAQMTGH